MRKYLLTFLFIGAFSKLATGQELKLTQSGFADVKENSKNFIVIDAPGKAKNDLYNSTLKFISSTYNNPKFVTTKIDGEQIIIDAVGPGVSKRTMRLSESNVWDLNYKLIIDFKDSKIRVEPIFKNYENLEGSNVILSGKKVLGNVFGLFNDKGKPNSDKAIKDAEAFINDIIKRYADNIKVSKDNNDW
ncbi:DUF4468 domain-containing protein [Sphingobacterium spiritivorum]|uniref:DUF4468 domain-containing protein n=1 Tax=Sphingobacterium spiritivorum TaxID=258 RepID=UPI003DA3C3E5